MEEEKTTAEFTDHHLNDNDSQSSSTRGTALAALSASIGAAAGRLSGTFKGGSPNEKLNSINCMQTLVAAVDRRRKSK